MMPFLFLACIGLAGLFFWASGLPGTWESSRGRLRAGAAVMLALAAFVGYAWFRETKAPSELQRIIPVYPNAVSTGLIPQVSQDRIWIFDTPDGLDAVAAFYEQVAAESGWSLHHSGDGQMLSIKMENDGTEVSLQVLDSDGKSKLTYIVGAGD